MLRKTNPVVLALHERILSEYEGRVQNQGRIMTPKTGPFFLSIFYLRGVVSLTRVLVSVPRGVASRPRLLEADSYLIMMFRYEFEFWNQRRI